MAAVRNTPQEVLFQQILAEFKEMNSEIAGLRVEMENFKETLEPITRIIRGDGVVQSLSTQIEVLRTQFIHISTIITKSESKLKELQDRADKSDQEDKRGRWTVVAAIVTGLLALSGAIVGLVVALTRR